MPAREPPTIDMTPGGDFVDAPRRGFALPIHLPWQMRLFLAAIALSFVVGLIACLAILAYFLVMAVPVFAGLMLLGILGQKLRLWRAGGSDQRSPARLGD